jgi:hypothetical protein
MVLHTPGNELHSLGRKLSLRISTPEDLALKIVKYDHRSISSFDWAHRRSVNPTDKFFDTVLMEQA